LLFIIYLSGFSLMIVTELKYGEEMLSCIAQLYVLNIAE
jgi:hypothetical protein